MGLAIETRGLRRLFGDLVAVDSIDLAVPSGSFYGFLGPNGAGKSTTMKCLTGLLAPSAGTMRILGMDPAVQPTAVKRKVGVLPEDLALFDRLTGNETLTFVGRIHGLDGTTLRSRSEELLELLSLTDAANVLAGDYSHGMRKKLSLATALLPAPRLLFLDEPFEGIDAVAARLIKDLLRGYVRNGGTIFLTSHILEIVEQLTDQVGVIHHGRLVAQGPLDHLKLSSGSDASLEAIFLQLVGATTEAGGAPDWLR